VTDYLSALATRALVPRQVLQPRLPGRFESMIGEVVAPAAGEHAAPWQERDVLETRGAQPARSVEGRSFPRVEERASEALASPRDDRASSPLPSIPALRRDAAASSGQTPALPVPAFGVPAIRPEVRPAAITIERKGVGETIENETVTPHAAAPASKPRMSQPSARTIVRERAAPPRVVERLRVRRDESIAAHPATAPVEITIGRIDVRAVVAAQPPALRAKAQPHIMSLDEYAAKRDGRRK